MTPPRFSILTTLVIAVVLIARGRTQYYMYTPGTSILPYISSPFDTYGAGINCNIPPTGTCAEDPSLDPTMCQYIPASVSTTPYINVGTPTSFSQTSSYYSAPGASGGISVMCGDWDFGYTVYRKLFVTFNGTLPDIFGTPTRQGYGTIGVPVTYSPGVVQFIVARCIEGNRTASRIAYAKRIPWDLTINGSWCANHGIYSLPTPQYHDLALPMCNPAIMGAACDGQTIVAMPTPGPVTSPPPPRTTTMTSGGPTPPAATPSGSTTLPPPSSSLSSPTPGVGVKINSSLSDFALGMLLPLTVGLVMLCLSP
jgi:hypothetical protein